MITNLIRENRKTLSIIIDKNGEVKVKAPKNMPIADIVKFFQSKEKWIQKQQAQIKQSLDLNKEIIDYKKILYLGNKYECCYMNSIKEISVLQNKLLIPLKYETKKIKIVANWLKNRAKEVLENRLLYFSWNYKLAFNDFCLINSKNRWGTCSTKKEIAFNWRLIMLSPRLIDYVIVHELCHLLQPNHSDKFWAVVETIMPDYKERRDELKKCGFILTLYR